MAFGASVSLVVICVDATCSGCRYLSLLFCFHCWGWTVRQTDGHVVFLLCCALHKSMCCTHGDDPCTVLQLTLNIAIFACGCYVHDFGEFVFTTIAQESLDLQALWIF